MMKAFQNKMKQRFRVSPSIFYKYKTDIFIMEEIDSTFLEVVELRLHFIKPLEYEVSDDLLT